MTAGSPRSRSRTRSRPPPAAGPQTPTLSRPGGTRPSSRDSIHRPLGLRFDTGGTGKGLAADLLAVRFASNERWAVDCGGDLRVRAPHGEPFEVDVRHPLTGEPVHRLRMTDGAVATSGLDRRLWRAEDGTPRHHILDPATGEPAWTGLIGATALAPTALEAEALAKAALLSGPRAAGRWLRRHGGVTFLDDGEFAFHGPARPRPVVRLSLAA